MLQNLLNGAFLGAVMHILVVSQYFLPEEFHINDIASSLCKKGIQVDVLTGQPNYPGGRIFSNYKWWGLGKNVVAGMRVFRVPLVPRGNSGSFRLLLNYCSFVLSALLFGPLLVRRQKYDAIMVYGTSPILQAIPAIYLGFLKSAPVTLWLQDLWPESLAATKHVRNETVLSAIRLLVGWIYRRTNLILIQSRAFEPSVRAICRDTPIVYFPNSVDIAFVDGPRIDAPLPILPELDDSFVVMLAGNVGIAQAPEVILEAARLLQGVSQIRFVVLGQGSRWESIRDQAKALGLRNLHLPGRFPVQTMPALMRKAAVLLVTLTDEPIFALTVPNKVQAYMAAGRPILACLNGEGARLVTEAQAGLSVPAENARALADAVMQLYNMPMDELAQMGANGRRYFKTHFDHDKLVDELIAHLRALSNTPKDAR